MNQTLRGSIYVVIAASCYGVLTTFVKLSYEEGFTTDEITFAQLAIGFIGLSIMNLWVRKTKKPIKAKKMSVLWLMLSGTSLGFTSIFYYLAMHHISVSVGIVLLMQSVWMGVITDAILNKIPLTTKKITAVVLILIGTVLAADLLLSNVEVSLVGIGLGLLAALSYTVTIFTSNKVALELHFITRSKWMMLGGLIVVIIFAFPSLINTENAFNWSVFIKWGPILALFGTILPPLFFTAGMPKINVGIGAIISAIELPVAVIMGYFVLKEEQNIYKWAGISLIIASIILMNLKKASNVIRS